MTGEELQALRDRFPVTERYAYLNHAAIAPPPAEAADQVAALARVVSQTGDRRWPERNDECERVRRQAARLLGAPSPHEVAFVGNTSEALSVVASGLDWRPGENLVTVGGEFPSNVYPWWALRAAGVEVRTVARNDGRVEVDDLAAALDGGTRLVALSWVGYDTGFRVDLAALADLCRRRDILLVVDVIQGLGALAFDAPTLGVDVAATATHKWLLGPEGVGLLYVSDRVVERIRSPRHGWRSVRHKFAWTELDPTPAEGALRYEAGTLNMLGIHAAGASLDLLLELGPQRVERRVLALARRAAERLAEAGFVETVRRGPEERSGIVAVRHPERSVEAAVAALERHDVIVSHRAGRLRVAPHVYNREEEIDRLGEILRSEPL